MILLPANPLSLHTAKTHKPWREPIPLRNVLRLLFLLCFLPFHFPVQAAVSTLTQGYFIFSSENSPPAEELGRWNPVTLPDNWNISHPGQGGTGWYRFTFFLDHPSHDLWGIYLPRLSANAEVFANGVLVGSGGRLIEPISLNSFRPLLFSIPGGLLHPGNNIISIAILGYPNEMSGLENVQIGLATELTPRYERRSMFEVTAPITVCVLNISLSLGLFLLWKHHRAEPLYLMLALGSLCSGIYTSSFFLTEVPVQHSLWLWFIYTLAMGFSYIILLIIHRFVRVEHPLLERWAGAYTLIIPFLIAWTGPAYYLKLFGYMGASYALISPYLFYLVIRHRNTGHRIESLLLLLVLSVLAGIGVHDLDQMIFPHRHLPNYYAYWAASSMGLVITFLVILRFDRTLNRYILLNSNLNQQIEEKSQALASSYEERHALLTHNALLDERERILRDLHDGLGGYLISALALIDRMPQTTHALQKTLRTALDDLRLMVDSIDDKNGDLSLLIASVRERLDLAMDACNITLHWQVTAPPQLPNPSPSRHVQLIRMIQEIFNNVAKHSQAHHVNFILTDSFLEIRDDGIGFDPQSLKTGRGLTNLRRRAAELGLILTLRSGNHGTLIRLEWVEWV
ncbi:sensor histidine kinase [Ferrovum myxofaciens]|nr:histidine kinase [Ferrovum myxofaciens]